MAIRVTAAARGEAVAFGMPRSLSAEPHFRAGIAVR
jgi:hypothetical protein